MMLNTPEIGHQVHLVTDVPTSVAPPAYEPPLPRLGIDWLHRTAAGALIDEPGPEVVALVVDAATPLALGTDRERNEARIRLAARQIAVYRVMIQTTELALAEAVARRDDQAVAILGRVLDGNSKRMRVWLDEHRTSCTSGQRSVQVAIGTADEVTILGPR